MVNINCDVDTIVLGQSVTITSNRTIWDSFYEDGVKSNDKFQTNSYGDETVYTPTTVGTHTIYFTVVIDDEETNTLTFTVINEDDEIIPADDEGDDEPHEDDEIGYSHFVFVNVQVNYGSNTIQDVPVLLTHTITKNQYEAITDKNGECTIKIGANTLEELMVDYLVEVDCTEYSTNTNIFTATSQSNELLLYLVKVDDCQNQILTNKNCKYFHHDPYMTPNNFDLYFDHSKIPSNIIQESPHNLLKRLQRTLPLTKILHLNLQSEQDTHLNCVNIHTKAKIRFNERILTVEKAPLTIIGKWGVYGESSTEISFQKKFYYTSDYKNPIVGMTVKFVNIEYPLISYSGVTDENGDTYFSVPIGTYKVLYILNDGKWYSENMTVMAGVTGKKTLGINLFMDSQCPDLTEFEVSVVKNKGASDEEVVDTVVLNAVNNYTATTRELPVFNEDNIKIDYDVVEDRSNCDVIIDDEDTIGVIKHEEVLL